MNMNVCERGERKKSEERLESEKRERVCFFKFRERAVRKEGRWRERERENVCVCVRKR